MICWRLPFRQQKWIVQHPILVPCLCSRNFHHPFQQAGIKSGKAAEYIIFNNLCSILIIAMCTFRCIDGPKFFLVYLAFPMALFFSVEKISFGQVFRIMPLGNSITEGMDNTAPTESQRISYRKELFDLMTARGYNFDFVGHDNSGYDLLSDADHGGIPGARAQYVVRLLQDGYDLRNNVQITPGSRPYLDVWPADIILLHIGTNDITHGEGSSIADLSAILDEIDAWKLANRNPVAVFVAKIIQRTDNTELNLATIQLNNNVAAMVASRGDPSIRIVDIESGAGINYSTEMQSDGIHPKQSAYDRMGQKWFSAIEAYLDAIPVAPGDFSSGEVTEGSVHLTWSDDSNNESAFEIDRAAISDGPFTLITISPANSSGHTDTGLTANTTYYYRIRAVNATGPSLYSPVLSVRTHPVPPLAPSGLTAGSPTTSSLQLLWTDWSDNETGFQIERSLTPGSGFELIHTTSANITSYNDTGLNHGTRYYYRIRATNGLSHSEYSNETSGETLPAVPEAPAYLIAGSATLSSLRISWTDRSNSETGFQIERSLTPGTGFHIDPLCPGGCNQPVGFRA
jgi:lysophospholipase L1-like esterase